MPVRLTIFAFEKLRKPIVNAKQCQERNRRFRIARANVGATQKDVAHQIGVSEATLSNVLHGRRTSARVEEAIRRFIERHYPKQAA